MAEFKVGDKVVIPGGDVGTITKIVGSRGGFVYKVEVPGFPGIFYRESILELATDTKSLRAKYKAAPSGTRFVVLWNTGDRDTCYGRRDLMDLLDETECTVEYGKVIDKDTGEKVGTVQEVS